MGNYLLSRAKYIIAEQGLLTLMKRGTMFMIRPVFSSGTFNLYEHTIRERDEEEYLPRTDKITFVIISSKAQIDELVEQGFENVCKASLGVNVEKCLKNGAIAFCFFIDKELAHIGWVALTGAAKDCFDNLPYYVDFSQGQACTGGTVTIPKYGGNGLMRYGYYLRFEFLREKGYITSRNAVRKGNVASEKAHAKFSPCIYAQARYFRIFKWKYWKQMPLD